MKILCFGDSNTWGHDPVDCSRLERRWPVILRELLDGCEVIEEGECGRNTMFGDPALGFKNGLAAFRELLKSGVCADIAIVMLGTNDTLNDFDKSPEESAEAIRLYIREWKAACPGSKFLVISPIVEREQVLTHEIFGELYSAKSLESSKHWAPLYAKVAEDEGVDFMDASQYANASDIDGIHMVPSEHEKLAKAIYAKIKEMTA